MPEPLPLSVAIRRTIVESQQCRFVGDPGAIDAIIDERVRPLVEALRAVEAWDHIEYEHRNNTGLPFDLSEMVRGVVGTGHNCRPECAAVDAALKAAGAE